MATPHVHVMPPLTCEGSLTYRRAQQSSRRETRFALWTDFDHPPAHAHAADPRAGLTAVADAYTAEPIGAIVGGNACLNQG